MKKIERENFLLQEIKKHDVLTVKEFYQFAKANGIVEITARRDLQNFINLGLVEVTLGAIRYIANFQREKTRWAKKNQNSDLKRQIAKKAASYLEPGDIVFVNPGTTNEIFVRNIVTPIRQLVTNGLEIFNAAKENEFIEHLTLIGGNYRPESTAFVGHDALAILDKHKFTKGFFTGTNVTNDLDIYNNNEAETDILLKALKQSKQKIGLFDHTKFSDQGYSYVMPASNLDILITNKQLKKHPGFAKSLSTKGKKLKVDFA